MQGGGEPGRTFSSRTLVRPLELGQGKHKVYLTENNKGAGLTQSGTNPTVSFHLRDTEVVELRVPDHSFRFLAPPSVNSSVQATLTRTPVLVLGRDANRSQQNIGCRTPGTGSFARQEVLTGLVTAPFNKMCHQLLLITVVHTTVISISQVPRT